MAMMNPRAFAALCAPGATKLFAEAYGVEISVEEWAAMEKEIQKWCPAPVDVESGKWMRLLGMDPP